MKPRVGKSGAGICSMSWATVISGLSSMATTPRATSPRLWGGILVAMPTAMPELPLIKRAGTLDGMMAGSAREPS